MAGVAGIEPAFHVSDYQIQSLIAHANRAYSKVYLDWLLRLNLNQECRNQKPKCCLLHHEAKYQFVSYHIKAAHLGFEPRVLSCLLQRQVGLPVPPVSKVFLCLNGKDRTSDFLIPDQAAYLLHTSSCFYFSLLAGYSKPVLLTIIL